MNVSRAPRYLAPISLAVAGVGLACSVRAMLFNWLDDRFTLVDVYFGLLAFLLLVPAWLILRSKAGSRALYFSRSALVAFVLFEALLRVLPSAAGREFVNGARSKFHSRAGGIFSDDPRLPVPVMRPHFRTTIEWNGYLWHHETDSLGYRNAGVRFQSARALLLGDSKLYGLGIEQADTLSSLLGPFFVNLGVISDFPYRSLIRLSWALKRFDPRIVFYVFSDNDLSDIYSVLGRDKAEKLMERGFSPLPSIPDSLDPNLYRPAYPGKPLTLCFLDLLQGRLWPLESPPIDGLFGERFTLAVFARMRELASHAGAGFVVLPVLGGTDRFGSLFHALEKSGIPVIKPNLTSKHFLPIDGHLNRAGNTHLAELVKREYGEVLTPRLISKSNS